MGVGWTSRSCPLSGCASHVRPGGAPPPALPAWSGAASQVPPARGGARRDPAALERRAKGGGVPVARTGFTAGLGAEMGGVKGERRMLAGFKLRQAQGPQAPRGGRAAGRPEPQACREGSPAGQQGPPAP